jgi:hypothetical protein
LGRKFIAAWADAAMNQPVSAAFRLVSRLLWAEENRLSFPLEPKSGQIGRAFSKFFSLEPGVLAKVFV